MLKLFLSTRGQLLIQESFPRLRGRASTARSTHLRPAWARVVQWQNRGIMNAPAIHRPTLRKPAKPAAVRGVLEAVAKQSGQPLEVVTVFASISDPANKSRFSAAAALKAFAHVKVPAGG